MMRVSVCQLNARADRAENLAVARDLLARAARHLVPDGRPVWAQCAPGNASSLRALLAAGYTPVGSEVLLIPPRR